LTAGEARTNRRGAKRQLDMTVASQRRKQIITAARECIAEEGVDKLTLRKVADRAQMSHATIAYYFNSRRELVDTALLEISKEFMTGLRQREPSNGTWDLIHLNETFLDPDNSSSRFVVLIIDAGLHDPELRGMHDEFVSYGRESIERSIRVGMERGELREDLDPVVAAALVHTVQIWWQSELAANATSREMALSVGNLVLSLLQQPHFDVVRKGLAQTARSGNDHAAAAGTLGTTVETIETSLMSDSRLSPRAAATLVETFTKLYELAADTFEPEGR
jgi:AcrR family transcriptional regulator